MDRSIGLPTSIAFLTLFIIIECIFASELPKIKKMTVMGHTGTIRITCFTEGYPPPISSWQFNGSIIQEKKNKYHIRYNNQTQLVIYHANDSDSGTYKCLATNELGTMFAEKLVRIKGVGHFLNGYNQYSKPLLRNITVGKPYKLTCPPHTVKYGQQYKWIQEPFHVWKTGSPVKRVFMSKDGSLIFSYTRRSDIHRINKGYGISCVLVADLANLVPSVPIKLQSDGTVYRGTAAPKIEVFMSPVTTAIEGDISFQLECGATGRPHPSFTWYKDDIRISIPHSTQSSIGDNVYFEADGMLLNIKTVKKESAGRYRCVASNIEGDSIREGVLIVNSHVKWIKEPSSKFETLLRNPVKLEFVADGTPKPIYEWYHNGTRIFSSSRRRIIDGLLEIPVSSFEDGGLYLFEAKNYINTIVSAVYVEIKAFPPTFLQDWEEEYYFLEGYKNHLYCNVTGGPMPTITWYHNEMVIQMQDPYLEFKESSKSHNGIYKCFAENIEGVVEMRTKVIVFAETVITKPPANVTFAQGSLVNLFCDAIYDKTLPVKYEWVTNGKIVTFTDRIHLRKRVKGLTNILQIEDLKFRDAGKYSCRVYTVNNSTFRSQDEKAGSVTVIGSPVKPRNINLEGDCAIDDEITLSWEAPCKYIGPIDYYKVEYASVDDIYKWYEFKAPNLINKTSVTLKMSELPPSTSLIFRTRGVAKKNNGDIYGETCDTTKHGTCISPAEAPITPPFNLSASLDDHSNINVTWTAFDKINQPEPGFQIIVSYRMVSKEPSNFTTVTLLGSDNYFVIPVDNQEEGGVYDIYVKGANRKGVGPAAYLNVQHPGIVEITESVENFAVVMVTENSVMLSWDEISSATGYIIYYARKDRRNRRESSNHFKVLPKGGSGTINNLQSNEKYEISIAAMNLKGNGPLSDPIFVVTQRDVPGVPLDVGIKTYGKVIFLSWSPPYDADKYLSHYTISWYESGDHNKEKHESMIVPATHQQAFIKSTLDSMTYYTVELAASNDIGKGEAWVMEGVVISEPDLPGKPAPPLIIGLNESTINVTFLLPSLYYGGMPEKFKVFYLQKGVSDKEIKYVSGVYPDQSWVLLDTLNFSIYKIWSIAENNIGFGEYSDPVEGMPLELTTTMIPTTTADPNNGSIPIVIVGKAVGNERDIYSETWFIFLIALIIIIIIIALLLCVLVHKGGGKYQVGKKERKLGGWDNQLLKDYSDNPMDNPNGIPHKKPKEHFYNTSQNSIAKEPISDDDNDSLDYYGEDNTFDEDGSFIGEYAEDKRTLNGETLL